MKSERDLTPEEIAELPLLLGFGRMPTGGPELRKVEPERLIKTDPSGNTLREDGKRPMVWRD